MVLLALVAAPAMADWKQDYARGVEAARDGRWDDVERYMQSAIAGNATPAERLRLYGQRYETYAPQHYAGLAALRKGDCSAALRYWSQGGNEAFIGSVPDLAEEERKGRNDCSARLAAQEPTPPPVAQEKPRETPVAPPSVPPPRALPPPSRPIVVETPPSRPLAEAPPAQQSSSISKQILRPLVDAYLDGRYADVLKLSASVPPTPRLRWHMLTLRAAAAFNLSQLGQSKDAARIARQAADDARKSDPTLKPDSEFFSPKFVRYFAGP
jgi:hypothetical protein